MVLYQWTHRATCHATADRSFQVGPPSLMASVLNSPIADSHRALSSASPTVPIDPAIPASISSAVKATDVAAGIGMVDQPSAGPLDVVALTHVEGLAERVKDQPGLLRAADPPAKHPAGEDVDDERDVAEPGQGPHVGEVLCRPSNYADVAGDGLCWRGLRLRMVGIVKVR